MVKLEGKTYKCEICGFHYESEKIAEDCEEFCKTHSACNIEIIQHAVENKGTNEF